MPIAGEKGALSEVREGDRAGLEVLHLLRREYPTRSRRRSKVPEVRRSESLSRTVLQHMWSQSDTAANRRQGSANEDESAEAAPQNLSVVRVKE